MTAATRTMMATIVRHLKGVILAIETWLNESQP
jgi:hypothetical protein